MRRLTLALCFFAMHVGGCALDRQAPRGESDLEEPVVKAAEIPIITPATIASYRGGVLITRDEGATAVSRGTPIEVGDLLDLSSGALLTIRDQTGSDTVLSGAEGRWYKVVSPR